MIKIELYHGTTSKYTLDQIYKGVYSPGEIELSETSSISILWASIWSGRYSTNPILLLFNEGNIKKMHHYETDKSIYLTGEMNVSDMLFLNRFGEKGQKGLEEIAEIIPGAVIADVPHTSGALKVYIPTVEEVITHVKKAAGSKEELNMDYLNALAKAHSFDSSAVNGLRLAASAGKIDYIDEIVKKARRI